MAYICENTGSRKGHKVTLYVFKTGKWYKESGLETFMGQKYPAELRHRWISFRGDGYNILGDRVIRAHGAPQLQLTPDVVGECVALVDDASKKALYDQLSKGEYETTKKVSEEVMRLVVDSKAAGE